MRHHCPACVDGDGWDTLNECPGVECPECVSKDSEIKRLDKQTYRLGDELADEKLKVMKKDAEIARLINGMKPSPHDVPISIAERIHAPSIKQWKITVREFELKLKEKDRDIDILEAKVADLRADLRACALALECVRHASPSWSIDFAACDEVLNRRGVQAILKS